MRGVGSWDARVRRGCLGLLRVTSASSSSSASTFTAASTAAAVQDAPGPDDILVDGDQLQASTSTSNSNATDATNATNLTRSGHSDKVLEALIKAEDVPISLTGVRERVLKIQRIGSQLKVNLRPLWSAASTSLGTLATSHPSIVWSVFCSEFDKTDSGDLEAFYVVPSWKNEIVERGKDEMEEERVDERSWRDPSWGRMRGATRGVFDRWEMAEVKNEIIKDQISEDRLDIQNYFSQLLNVLSHSPSFTHQYSKFIIPRFIALFPKETSTPPRVKLSAWLSLLSTLPNPKSLPSYPTLHEIYLRILSHPDRSLQSLSLTALLSPKSHHTSSSPNPLKPHATTLQNILDDKLSKDTLVNFSFGDIEQGVRGEVVGVFVRMFYGVLRERKGRGRGGGGGGKEKRRGVLGLLEGCEEGELALLVGLMIKPFSHPTSASPSSLIAPVVADGEDKGEGDGHGEKGGEDGDGGGVKQQLGFLVLLGDVLRGLGTRMVPSWPELLRTTLDITIGAQKRIEALAQSSHSSTALEDIDGAEADEGQEDDEKDDPAASGSGIAGAIRSLRNLRQLGLKRLADFCRSPISFDFTPFIPPSYSLLITPRLPSFVNENSQSPSTLLELFTVWSSKSHLLPYLVYSENPVLPRIYACLEAASIQPSVVAKIFDVVDNILKFASEDENIARSVLDPYVDDLLRGLSKLMTLNTSVSDPAGALGKRQISLLSQLSSHITDPAQVDSLFKLFAPFLRKPARIIPEKTKVDIMTIYVDLMPQLPELRDEKSALSELTFRLCCDLFQSLRSRQARLALVSVFGQLAEVQTKLKRISGVMADLNAYSTKRMDEPDFDRRLAAFALLNDGLHSSLDVKEWRAVLNNMLQCIQETDELALRTNASSCIKRFVEAVSATSDQAFMDLFNKLVFSALKRLIRAKSELVRAEVLSVLHFAVLKCSNIKALAELQILLANGDEEANFFNNIYHIQIHRRTRALRRLGEHCDEGSIRGSTLADIFVPLVSTFIQDHATLDHTLINESISTIGKVARVISWGPYNRLVQFYMKLIHANGKEAWQEKDARVYVRTLVAILGGFHFPMEEKVVEVEEAEEGSTEDQEEHVVEEVPAPVSDKPSQTVRIADSVTNKLLPSLLKHLEGRGETDDSLRIPISLGIVDIALHLPEAARQAQISRLLTVLSQILRSKSQDTRDLVRDTLCRIAVSLGGDYFPTIVRELRAALLRGPQLHVLATMVHALLNHCMSAEHVARFSNIDLSVPDIAHVAAEVIFGESAKDVLSEDFKTKMREVRGSANRALEIFTIVARHISPPHIKELLQPIRGIMRETESLKFMQSVDDVLRRIATGLNSNERLDSGAILVLSHTLITQNAKFLQVAEPPSKKKGKAASGDRPDYLVQTKRVVTTQTDHYATNSHRFVAFGLELFSTAMRRSRFDFQDKDIIAKLEPMVSVIGNTLYAQNGQVISAGLRATAYIVKCPLRALDKSLPVLVKQTLVVIRQTGATDSEVVQNALKALAVIIRECPKADLKESDLRFLLEVITPDFEEVEQQSTAFTLLRAILHRKFVVHEIYDIMDKVAEIMVTNQSPQVQEVCRGALLQFLLDYPQGKGRFHKQMTFLARNLSYSFESGRKSVMELLSAIFSKVEVALLREYADLFFVALVMALANDDSAKCREMAANLIRGLFDKLDAEGREVIFKQVHTWASQHTHKTLVHVALQVYGLAFEGLPTDFSPYLPVALEDLLSNLRFSVEELERLESGGDDGEDQMEIDIGWQAPYQALCVLEKLLRTPQLIPDDSRHTLSQLVVDILLFPHIWVRTASCRILGLLFTASPISRPGTDARGIFSAKSMAGLAGKLCSQLRSQNLDEPLGLQVVKNLFYVGKCFCLVPEPTAGTNDSETVPEDSPEQAHRAIENPLPWLFSKLSYQARSVHIARRNRSSNQEHWEIQLSSILRWFAAMANHMDSSIVEKFLVHILTPVYRLVDDESIRDPKIDDLKVLTQELIDLIQNKVGTTKFSTIYNQIRQGVVSVRRERKAERVMQVVQNPEEAAKRKIQRNTVKKESRKRKNREFAYVLCCYDHDSFSYVT
ncbi:ARM repeat-containing protein [Sistotremastrum suecicum HHB10207 ss-3]|uniref:ARM repeat-containing protein n=1 Tax=Sistotremastrum suecicum HHB10207 ss-3 TaxID=1314776 RepID=A0A166GQ04_9AGAM|nr:ARM repeat-containing protein [Sistotremastrum suecicum HHB10207 ss-3]